MWLLLLRNNSGDSCHHGTMKPLQKKGIVAIVERVRYQKACLHTLLVGIEKGLSVNQPSPGNRSLWVDLSQILAD